mmetsp:Transcript_31586/g.79217  ORF Transcript_31586/g.79217 Transcript_31586/m.79217 type:complete len:286 (+) Transcript_31586:1944-2801(+)
MVMIPIWIANWASSTGRRPPCFRLSSRRSLVFSDLLIVSHSMSMYRNSWQTLRLSPTMRNCVNSRSIVRLADDTVITLTRRKCKECSPNSRRQNVATKRSSHHVMEERHQVRRWPRKPKRTTQTYAVDPRSRPRIQSPSPIPREGERREAAISTRTRLPRPPPHSAADRTLPQSRVAPTILQEKVHHSRVSPLEAQTALVHDPRRRRNSPRAGVSTALPRSTSPPPAKGLLLLLPDGNRPPATRPLLPHPSLRLRNLTSNLHDSYLYAPAVSSSWASQTTTTATL